MSDRIDLRRFDPVEPPEEWPERLSQTLLAHHDKCPRSAYLYMKYRGGKASHAMDRGTAMHITAERALTTMVESDEHSMPPEMVLEELEVVLGDTSLGLVVPEEEKDGLRAMAWNFGDYTWIDPPTVIAIERMFEVEIGGWPIIGKVDLGLNLGDAIIDFRDWKTRYGMAEQSAIDKGFQGNLYLVAAAFGRWAETDADRNIISVEDEIIGAGINRFRFAEYYPLTTWDAEGTLAYRETVVDRDYLTNKRRSLETAVSTFESRLETGDYPAIDGHHCAICPAKWECPIIDAVKGEVDDPEVVLDEAGHLDTEEQAQEYARRWYWHGEIRKKLWAAIKSFGEENGALRFGRDFLLEWRPVTETKRLQGQADLETAIAAAIETGKPFVWDEFFKESVYVRFTLRRLTPDEIGAESVDI